MQQNDEICIQITMIAHYSGIIGLLLISQTAAIFGIFSIVVASPQVTTNAISMAFITVSVMVMNAITLIQNYKWFGATLTLISFIGIPYVIARKNNKTHRDIETCVNTIHNQNMMHNTYISLDHFVRILFSFIRAILLCFTQGRDIHEPVAIIDKNWCNVDENNWCNVDENNIISGKRPRITRNYSEECFEESEEEETEEEESEKEETEEEESEEEESEEEEPFEEREEESEIEESEFGGEQIRRLRIYNKKNDDETEDEYLNRLVHIAEEEDRQVVNNVLADVADKVGPQEIEVVDEEMDEILDDEVLDDEVLDQEVLDDEVLDQEVLDQEVLDQEVLDDEVLDQEVLDQEVLDQSVDKVLEEKDSDEDAYFRAKKDSLW